MIKRSLCTAIMAMVVLFVSQVGAGEEPAALWNWERALSRFQQAGVLIGQHKLDEAKVALEAAKRDLPAPYSEMAAEHLRKLDNSCGYDETLSGLCAELGAFPEAVDLARKGQEAYEQRMGKPSPYGHEDNVASWLALSGKVDEAIAEYREGLKRECYREQSWQQRFQKQIELLSEYPRRVNDPAFVLEYLHEARGCFVHLKESKRALGLQCDASTRKQFYLEIIRTLDEIHDAAGLAAWEDKLMKDFPDDRDAAASVWVNRGQRAHGARKLDEALAMYRKAASDYPDAKSYGIAQFNVGMVLKQEKKYGAAITEFSKLLGSKVNDQDPGAHIMEAYRNYRPRAQWEIGHCLFEKGNYDGALKAYATTRDVYPFQSWCGNEQDLYKFMYAFQEGLCYEYLGKYEDAVKAYLKAAFESGYGFHAQVGAHLRLVHLYEAAGQLDRLRRIADERGEALAARERKETGRELPAGWREEWHKDPIYTLLTMREWEKQGDWPKLVALIGPRGSTGGPDEADERNSNWQSMEAGRLLARHAKEATPLLIERLHKDEDPKWIYYALGLCATPGALAALRQTAMKEENCWQAYALVYSVSLAGKVAKPLLDDIGKAGTYHMRAAVEMLRKGELGESDQDPRFPRIPPKLTLPASVE